MAKLTAANIVKIDRMNPTTQEVGLGTSISETQTGQMVAFTADKTDAFSSAAVAMFTAPFAMRIVDVIVECQASEGSGTVKVLKATTEICTAIACATDGVVSHMAAGATAASKAQRLLATGDVINIQAAGGTAANIKAHVTVIGVRV